MKPMSEWGEIRRKASQGWKQAYRSAKASPDGEYHGYPAAFCLDMALTGGYIRSFKTPAKYRRRHCTGE